MTVNVVHEVPKTDKPKLGCRRCGGWGRVALGGGKVICDLCDGSGSEPIKQ